jgi:hypothetical protein
MKTLTQLADELTPIPTNTGELDASAKTQTEAIIARLTAELTNHDPSAYWTYLRFFDIYRDLGHILDEYRMALDAPRHQ